jgi:hypothetical protein
MASSTGSVDKQTFDALQCSIEEACKPVNYITIQKIAPPKPAGKIPPTFKVFCEFDAAEARPERAACGPRTQASHRE